MVDITHKSSTLRQATAEAIIRTSHPDTLQRVENNDVPKGNVLEAARVAGLLAIKKTPELIPDCHPLPIEHAHIAFETGDQEIRVSVTVKTIYKTGVEVEAMTGASIAALTIYDMLKPIDKGLVIGTIQLLEKKGGKSDHQTPQRDQSVQIVVCSDSVSEGRAQDQAGEAVKAKFMEMGIEQIAVSVIADDAEQIRKQVEQQHDDVLIFVGGTGAGPRDITPQTIFPLLDLELPGVTEAIRSYGQDRTPYAMLSRSLAGVRNNKVILAIPGSTKGALEAIDAVFPELFHLFDVMKGKRHG